MNKASKYLIIFLLALCFTGVAFSQDTIKKPRKNLRLSILGGPGYTPDYGFVIGGSVLATFSTNPKDTHLLRSVLPVNFGLTFGNNIGFNATIKPILFFHNDRIRVAGKFTYKNTGDNYYGVGYKENSSRERSSEITGYYVSSVQLNPLLLFRLRKSDIFLGPMIDYNYDNWSDVAPHIQQDEYYIRASGDSLGLQTHNLGLGFNLSYDSRDFPANAYKGLYFDLNFLYSARGFVSQSNYAIVSLDYRQYFSFAKKRVLAWTLNTKNSFGDIPMTRMPYIGSPFDIRGYYLGQYRDKSATFAMLEYRHGINIEQRRKIDKYINKLGFALWAGCGFIGENIIDIKGVLPNFGAGLRIEVQPRMNFRLDIGYNPIDKLPLIYFNMTEAF